MITNFCDNISMQIFFFQQPGCECFRCFSLINNKRIALIFIYSKQILFSIETHFFTQLTNRFVLLTNFFIKKNDVPRSIYSKYIGTLLFIVLIR